MRMMTWRVLSISPYGLDSYLQLPPEQYALLDPKWGCTSDECQCLPSHSIHV